MRLSPPLPELLVFLSAYDPSMVGLALAARKTDLAVAPKSTQSIDYPYSAVAIGVSFTGRLKGSFCDFAANSTRVIVSVNYDAFLRVASHIFKGNGNQAPHSSIRCAADLKNPEILLFIRTAILHSQELAATNGVPAHSK